MATFKIHDLVISVESAWGDPEKGPPRPPPAPGQPKPICTRSVFVCRGSLLPADIDTIEPRELLVLQNQLRDAQEAVGDRLQQLQDATIVPDDPAQRRALAERLERAAQELRK